MIAKVIGWSFVVALIAAGLWVASQPGTDGIGLGRDGMRGGEDRYCERHDCE